MKLSSKSKNANIKLDHIKASVVSGTFEGSLEEALELAIDTKCDVIFVFNAEEYHVSYKALCRSVEKVEKIKYEAEENE